jgi:hypothetical protein
VDGPLLVCTVLAGIAFFMGLAALVLAAEHQADIPALREEVDRLRSVVDRLSESVPEPRRAAGVAQEPAERHPGPPTAPIRVPAHPQNGREALRADTEPVAAVIDNGLRKLSGATASGRHRA